MTGSEKKAGTRSVRRGAFPTPKDVLAAAPAYHPPKRTAEPSSDAPKARKPATRARPAGNPKQQEEE